MEVNVSSTELVTMKQWGIILAVASNLLIAASLGLQKWVHMDDDSKEAEPKEAEPTNNSNACDGLRTDAGKTDSSGFSSVVLSGSRAIDVVSGNNGPQGNLSGGIGNQTGVVTSGSCDCSPQISKPVPERTKPGKDAASDGQLSATRNGLFWCAICGLILGEIGNFTAFGLASPTVISPLGAVAVVANAIIAATLLREPFSMRNFIGLLFAITGSVVARNQV